MTNYFIKAPMYLLYIFNFYLHNSFKYKNKLMHVSSSTLAKVKDTHVRTEKKTAHYVYNKSKLPATLNISVYCFAVTIKITGCTNVTQ